MKTKRSQTEIKGLIKKYLLQGINQADIGKILGITRQGVNYWIKIIRDEEKK